MRILIIRHAEPDYPNNTLTEKGFREAELLSHRLIHRNIRDIYASPLPRAVLTAEPTAKKMDKSITTFDWLQEFRGRLTDMRGEDHISWDIRPREWTSVPEAFDVNRWTSGKMYDTGTTRREYETVTAEFDRLLAGYGYHRDNVVYTCKENPDFTIAIFCHFALGMVLSSHLTGISPVLLWQSMFLPPSSVTEFITEERVKGEVVFKCLQMGDTSHLYAGGDAVSPSGLFPEFFAGENARTQVGYKRTDESAAKAADEQQV